jgi:hypothetical protein
VPYASPMADVVGEIARTRAAVPGVSFRWPDQCHGEPWIVDLTNRAHPIVWVCGSLTPNEGAAALSEACRFLVELVTECPRDELAERRRRHRG